jgi:hypothetical protein
MSWNRALWRSFNCERRVKEDRRNFEADIIALFKYMKRSVPEITEDTERICNASVSSVISGAIRSFEKRFPKSCLRSYGLLFDEEISVKEKKNYEKPREETQNAQRRSATPTTKDAKREPSRDSGLGAMRDLIAQRAYEMYEQRGKFDGEDMNDWLRAEAEILSSMTPGKRRSLRPHA